MVAFALFFFPFLFPFLLYFINSLLPSSFIFFSFFLSSQPSLSLPNISTDSYSLLHVQLQHTLSFAPVDLGCLKYLSCTLPTLPNIEYKKISTFSSMFLYDRVGTNAIIFNMKVLNFMSTSSFLTSEH